MIIGIDPDLEKSGVAILSHALELKNLTFPETVDLFRSQQDQIKKVVIEAGWVNKKANFRSGHSRHVDEQIAKRVGENHATGKLLVEKAKSLNLNVVEVRISDYYRWLLCRCSSNRKSMRWWDECDS